MTPIELLYELKKFIEENIKDIILTVRPVNNKVIPEPSGKSKKEKAEEQPRKRAAEVHLMRLTNKDAETNRIPYVLLQFLTGADEQEAGKPPDSECKIRIVVATYSEDGSAGSMDLLNVITRIRVALLKKSVIGKQFTLRKPLEYAAYPDETGTYYLGEMITIWGVPTIQREVNLYD
ncbi:MAG: hypothetical protein NC401_06655 [Ruminococcus sp.]|nr:hypothetical protein [Ruminococcus sp.]